MFPVCAEMPEIHIRGPEKCKPRSGWRGRLPTGVGACKRFTETKAGGGVRGKILNPRGGGWLGVPPGPFFHHRFHKKMGPGGEKGKGVARTPHPLGKGLGLGSGEVTPFLLLDVFFLVCIKPQCLPPTHPSHTCGRRGPGCSCTGAHRSPTDGRAIPGRTEGRALGLRINFLLGENQTHKI